MSACEHNNGTPHWDGYSCCDCGSFRTDYAWGIAANQWFKSRTEAAFYKANGRLPEPSAEELKSRIATLEADNALLVEERDRLREALEFYADGKNYVRELVTEECGCCSYWHDEKIGAEGDQGEVARAALEATR